MSKTNIRAWFVCLTPKVCRIGPLTKNPLTPMKPNENQESSAGVTRADVGTSALLAACSFLAERTGDCPQGMLDVQPHDIPCADACFEFTNKTQECWKRHFLNMANTEMNHDA